jgi:uncharacterized protein with von Willebrand factor type A (vWA) domain
VSDLPDDVAGLVHLLRAAGLEVGTHQAITLVAAAGQLGPEVTTAELYWAGRTTLVVHHEQLPVYDRVFWSWVAARHPRPAGEEAAPPVHGGPEAGRDDQADDGAADDGDHADDGREPEGGAPERGAGGDDRGVSEVSRHVDADAGEDEAEEEPDELAGAIASAVEALHRRRFSEATEEELQAIKDLMGNIVVAVPHRRSRRTRAARRGPVIDLRRSVRSAIQTDGELVRLPRRRRRVRPRRLVLVLDVSGSMAGYSRALLHFAYTARVDTEDVEVFCFGTRLTRLTDELGGRDVDRALAAAAARVSDWEGGTLIGQSLATLNRSFGRSGLLRGAVTVVCSDGLERGDPQQLGDEIARLARYAHRLVWVNPLKGDSRYQPLARGMAAALPHLDRFVSGHNLTSLDELAAVLRGL